MKIYTKKGDKGKTQLLGGNTVHKFNPKIEAYGSVDELNSFVGHLYDQEINKQHKIFLLSIQNMLLNLGSTLALEKKSNIKIPEISNIDIKKIEKEIDLLENQLPTLKNFILPSGHIASSMCQITRTVCRRAERRVVYLSTIEEGYEISIKFLNRLSDYLFVLSRKIIYENNGSEILWK
tara:strand:- start:56701 stop:57237 length:537 start_codon:yes stop_codon:yes gene_type:complete